jgi:hypothetical protein
LLLNDLNIKNEYIININQDFVNIFQSECVALHLRWFYPNHDNTVNINYDYYSKAINRIILELNNDNIFIMIFSDNPIKTFELPITLKICVISSQELNMKHFENMNELQILKISKSNIYNLELINPNIKQLLIHRSHIKCDLPKFSPDLYKLEIINSNISGMIDKFEFPKNLISLNLSDNKLSGIFIVPPSVIDLDISDNDITKLENIQNLQKLNIANNENIDMTDAQLAIIQHNQCNFIHNNGKYHKEEEYTQRQQEIHEMMMRHRQIHAMTSRNSDSFRPSTANKIEIKKFCSV